MPRIAKGCAWGLVLSALIFATPLLSACGGPSDDVASTLLDAGAGGAASDGDPSAATDGSVSCAPANSIDCAGKCGQVKSACGTIIDCGGCAKGQTCGGGGPNVCDTGTCSPSCAGKACGASDGCSGVCSAGSCPPSQVCTQNACVPNVPDGGATDTGGSTTRYIFVSSRIYNGNLGGLAGADATCQTLASAASLLGTYKAWLGDQTTSAASRLTHATGPYVLVNGTLVASNWAGLTSGTLVHPIDLTEEAGPPNNTWVWTDTDTSGQSIQSTKDLACNDWTSSTRAIGDGSVYGWSGDNTDTNNLWTGIAYSTCDTLQALYCVQQ
jgi:hypothetical protein